MRRYTQLAYLFHQCATSLLSRDGRIAYCTVRHPGVERLFSSFHLGPGLSHKTLHDWLYLLKLPAHNTTVY